MKDMKALSIIRDKHKRTVWRRAFRIWQHKPHEVAPLSTERHICSSCATEFTGNFCPRCGQSARVGRFSFKKAFLLFLDVWGMGNRGMYHTIRDLLLRPGYMIRDYICGMQSAYFPPFKMFFLLTALSLLVEHGFSFAPEEKKEDAKVEVATTNDTSETKAGQHKDLVLNAIASVANFIDNLQERSPAITSLLFLLLIAAPLFIFFRKSPTIPDLRFSEFIVAMVYTSNMVSIYSVIGAVFNSFIIKCLTVLMVFVAFRQFSGFSKKRVLGYIILSAVIAFVLLTTIILVFTFFVYYATDRK